MEESERMGQIIRRPIAWIPIVMSLAILLMVVTMLRVAGTARQANEGTTAHLFQLWLVIEVVAMAAFAVQWLPRRPTEALSVLIVQILCALAACAPVFYFRL
jgi:uncharacterized membrane protein